MTASTFLLAALLTSSPAHAGNAASATQDVAESYTTAVRLIDNLFLEPDSIDPGKLLTEAALGVSYEIPWLFVDVDEAGVVRLRHGDGRALGALAPSTMQALPAQLQALEGLVVRAPAEVPDDVDVRLSILQGLTRALDRYSRVLAGEGLARFDTRLKGTLVGIGASFAWQGDQLVVTRVDPTGPAETAGLRLGDRIERIDGRSTVNMSLRDVTERIRGDADSAVVLDIRRVVVDATEDREDGLPLTIRRAEVIVPNVSHEVLEDDVGYVRIDHISQRTVHNLRRALDALREQGALEKGLVIDLRGNTGGSMKEAARSADLFLERGLLLRTVGPDGGRVQNLEAEMQAVDSDDEPPIPVVILVDRRTASGSEIIAGALLEHGRTALVGTDTYGKGTVQKIYNLDRDKRLKLTVARYVLANDRRILPAGIPPDIRVGEVELGTQGMQLSDPPFADPLGLVVVEEDVGWRGEERQLDAVRELGRRAVLRAQGTTTRKALLDALAIETGSARARESAFLAEAMEARGYDWSAAPDEGSFPDAHSTLNVVADGPYGATVHLSVTNEGDTPLHRAFAVLDSSSSFWDDRAVPLGRIEPGATIDATIPVVFPAGHHARLDPVSVVLHTDRRPPSQLVTAPLEAEGRPEPLPLLDARIVPHAPGGVAAKGPHGHPVYRAELTVTHHGPGTVTGVETYFHPPSDERVELIDRGARTSRLSKGEPGRFDLTFEVAPDVQGAIDLELVADIETFGRWFTWELSLPLDGASVHYEAPTIELPGRPTSAEPGAFDLPLRIEDDGALGDITIWTNGRKTHWLPAKGTRSVATPTLELESGSNRITVVGRDDQGLMSTRTVYIQGVEPTITDAEPVTP